MHFELNPPNPPKEGIHSRAFSSSKESLLNFKSLMSFLRNASLYSENLKLVKTEHMLKRAWQKRSTVFTLDLYRIWCAQRTTYFDLLSNFRKLTFAEIFFPKSQDIVSSFDSWNYWCVTCFYNFVRLKLESKVWKNAVFLGYFFRKLTKLFFFQKDFFSIFVLFCTWDILLSL